MTDQPGSGDQKPAETPKPADAAAKPTPAAKPATPAAAGAHAAPAAEAKPAEPLAPGPFGQFLKDVGIDSTRLPDNFGTTGMIECIEVDAKDIEQTMKRLRGTEMLMTELLMVSGVESPDTFDSVYHLWSYEDPTKELVVKVRVPKASVKEGELPVVASITPFWPAANWHEREEYDLMGIKYFGHPYLRRLMNPWDWEGYPLRKDYKQPVDALNDKNPHSMR
jgi:NADH-quinone oxidoreductase subunit C